MYMPILVGLNLIKEDFKLAEQPIINIYLGGSKSGKKVAPTKKVNAPKSKRLSKTLKGESKNVIKKEAEDKRHSELLNAINGLPHQEHTGGSK